MSLHSYHVGLNLTRKDPPFYALIMAAMSKADTNNLAKLRAAFPETWDELQARYNARNLGVLPSDGDIDLGRLAKSVEELRRQK